MKKKLPERRRFVRLEIPLKAVIKSDDHTDEVTTTNISPVGLRFVINREPKESENMDISLYLSNGDDPVRLKTKVVWKSKTNLEDNAPYDVGVEIIEVDEASKNIFLKYLCDILYDSTFSMRS